MAQAPSIRETSISDEIRQGKKLGANNKTTGPGQRKLQSSRKILVRGYCSTWSPFPTSHFTNDIVFADPNTTNPEPQTGHIISLHKGLTNLTTAGAALLVRGEEQPVFTFTNNIGPAFDHLSVSRIIQSVGTPYQGTALAGKTLL